MCRFAVNKPLAKKPAFERAAAAHELLHRIPGEPIFKFALSSGNGAVDRFAVGAVKIAGTFRNAHLKYRGFIRDTGGNIVTVHFPASVGTYVTRIWNGNVTGSYVDGNGISHGYLRPDWTARFLFGSAAVLSAKWRPVQSVFSVENQYFCRF